MKKVAIIHPWFPRYRLEFFQLLICKARELDIEIQIFHGEAPPEWRDRGDAVEVEWATQLPTRFLKIRNKTLVWKGLAPVRRGEPFDLYILEHAVRSLETYRLIARHGRKISFWGHGKTYTQRSNLLLESLKKRLLYWSKWYFAYTEGGAKAVRTSGFPSNQLTVVQNSIDTQNLKAAVSAVTDREAEDFRLLHDIGGPTALFIGGLDSSKRLDFLLEASCLVAKSVPDFCLLIAGDGSQRGFVEEWANKVSWLRYLGPTQGADKATALQIADVLCMPGRVGLVAVDSFAATTPIVTTNWPYHAPEYEYLEDGVNAIVTPDTVHSYASGLIEVFRSPDILQNLRSGCLEASSTYSVEKMADNFIEGLTSVLAVPYKH